jgi:hypothetical protein
VFQLREQQPRFGKMIQIDGSPHNWFDGREDRSTPIVFIDDATGRLTVLQFAPADTIKAYLLGPITHLLPSNAPLAF